MIGKSPYLLAFWPLVGAAIVTGLLGQWPFAALCAVAAVAMVAIVSMKAAGTRREETGSDLHPSDYARLAPLRKHRNAIQELVEAKKNDTSIAIIGAEALAEADHILQQAAKLVQMRRELLRAAGGRTEAQSDLTNLDREIGQAQTEEERSALEAAKAARELEVSHYDRAEGTRERVESSLRQAEAAMAEMKARLTTAAAGADNPAETDELRETVGRLKSLGTSFDEAEAWLKG